MYSESADPIIQEQGPVHTVPHKVQLHVSTADHYCYPIGETWKYEELLWVMSIFYISQQDLDPYMVGMLPLAPQLTQLIWKQHTYTLL